MESDQKIIEKNRVFFKGVGKLLDVLGFLGIITSFILLSAVVFDFAQYMGKYSQIDYFDGIFGLLFSLLLVFFGNKLRKHDFYSDRYLIGTFLVLAPAPVFGFVGGIGAILWLVFIIQSIRGFEKIYKLKRTNNYNLVFDQNIPDSEKRNYVQPVTPSKIPMERSEKTKTINYGLYKGIVLSIVCVVLVFGTLFYWYALRPANIKKQCSMVAMKAYSQEEKDIAKRYLEDNCPVGGGTADRILINVRVECFNSKLKVDAPTIGGEGKKRPASDEEYGQCLREKGL